MVYRRGIASKARDDVNLGIGAPQIHPTALAAGQILSEQTIKVSKYLNNPDKPILPVLVVRLRVVLQPSRRASLARTNHIVRLPRSADANQHPPSCDPACRCAPGGQPERVRNHQREARGWIGRRDPAVGRWLACRRATPAWNRKI